MGSEMCIRDRSYSYFRPPPLARSVDRAVDRAPPPSPGRAWADVVERPPSPDRLLGSSPAVARPASPARSLAGPRSIVRPPSLASRRSCCFENSVSHNLHKIVRVCSIFYPHEGYRSVIPLDAARVNRTIFHNNSVHRYYITRIEGRDYIQHDILYDMVNMTCTEGGGYSNHGIITRYDQQAGCNIIVDVLFIKS